MNTQALEILLNCDDQGKPGELPAFAWPGGYTMFYVTENGDELCADCAAAELRLWQNNESDDPPANAGAYGATDDYPTYDVWCDNCGKVICEAAEA